MSSEPLVKIASVGARAAIGLSALQVALSARAGLTAPQETHFLDKRGWPVGMCRVGGLSRELHGYDRMLALAAPALREARPAGLREALPLFLALPEPGRPDDDPRLGGDFVVELAARSGAPVDLGRSRVVRAGHAGGAYALDAALAALHEPGGPRAALVGGVDSYHHPGVVRWLDEAYRLHAPDVENGFILGEGAAFALVVREPTASSRTVVRRVVTAREETVDVGAPNTAQAMTSLLHRLGGRLSWVLTDVNGERHRVREWSFAAMRGVLAEGAVESRFAGALGDLGAATGPVLIVIACTFFELGCAPATSAAVALHADGAERGAILLEATV